MEVADIRFTFDPTKQDVWLQGQRFPATPTMVTSEKTLRNAVVKCTTIEYKSQTRKHLQTASGSGYRIVANFGDQFSNLLGGHAKRAYKPPNPTYYLP